MTEQVSPNSAVPPQTPDQSQEPLQTQGMEFSVKPPQTQVAEMSVKPPQATEFSVKPPQAL
jgi:hypothetical protein